VWRFGDWLEGLMSVDAAQMTPERADREEPPTRAPAPAPAPAASESTWRPAAGLLVGAADDPAEAAADLAADRALSRLRRTAVAAAPAVTAPVAAQEVGVQDVAAPDLPPARAVRRWAADGGAAPAVVGRAGGAVPPGVLAALRRSKGSGVPLDAPIRRRMESAFDTGLEAIRVHRDGEADRLNRSFSARAFTIGSDIYFSRGSYSPGTADGDHVLAHEIAHTQQNSALRRSSIRRLDAGVADAAYQAMTDLDYRMLTDLADRADLVRSIALMAPDAQLQHEFLKQLVLTSTLTPEKIGGLLAGADADIRAGGQRRGTAISRLSARLRKAKQRSSAEVYGFIERCRKIHTDYYRGSYQTDQAKGAVDVRDLNGEAKGYDTTGGNAYQTKLQTTKKSWGRTKTVRHTLEDVVRKVDIVAGMTLVNTHAPDRAEGMTPQQKAAVVANRPRVGVVGAGPVGLMAALESRLQGADVYLFEARGDEYTRRQVLALDMSTMAKLQHLGVKFELFDRDNTGRAGEGIHVAVRYIEQAMRSRAQELGIDIRTGWSFAGAAKGAAGTKATFNVTDDSDVATKQHVDLDLLVLAAGPGITRGRGGQPSITDRLGFTFDVQEAKDYAAVGLFETNDSGSGMRGQGATREQKADWAYRFNTPKVTYVLQKIPEELYRTLAPNRDDTKEIAAGKVTQIQQLIGEVATKHFEMQNATFGPDRSELGARMPNVGVFPIEVQQARSMINEKLGILLIGDTAATPHPHTGSGYNTGVRELDALADVVASLRDDALRRANAGQAKGGGADGDHDPESDESPSSVATALRAYNSEVKELTDQMVAKALKTLAAEHSRFMTKWIAGLEQKYGSYLAADYRHGQRLEAIKGAIATMNGAKSTTAMQTRLDYMMEARRQLAEIERAMREASGR
jgi:2-polyprenyl-6-methoxyphenol hydroxylase-like FAD-dependent oxidoreductase